MPTSGPYILGTPTPPSSAPVVVTKQSGHVRDK